MENEKEKKGKKIATIVILAAIIIIMLFCLVRCQSGGGELDPTETTGAAVTTDATGEPTSEPTEDSEPTTAPTETSESSETTEEPTEATTEGTEPAKPTEPATEGTKPTEHSHSYSTKVTRATCTARGYTTYTCGCGDSYKDSYTEATGHSYGAWVTTKEPTTTATGYAECKCSGCGSKVGKELPKVVPNHTHSYTSKVTTAATCSSAGVKTFTCSCGDKYTESISKLGHSYSSKVTKAATCGATGVRTFTCSRCNGSYTESVPKTSSHSYGAWVTTREPTTTATGTAVRTCSVCGKTESKTLDKLPAAHTCSYTSEVTKAATCTAEGVMTYSCSCGKSYTETIPATSHSWVTHTTEEVGHEEGYRVCHCGGFSYSVELAKANPDAFTASYVAHINKAKEETGTTAGHSYYSIGKWVVDVPATSYTECSVCGARE